MKHIKILVLLSVAVHPFFMHGVCNQGTLTAVSGSPFSAGSLSRYIAYSSPVAGNVFAAVSNGSSNNISIYSVNQSTGVFSAVSGSPFTVGASPNGIAFSPLIYENLFLAEVNSSNVGVYTVDINAGTLTQVSGSPFTTGSNPLHVAFSPLINGNLFAAVSNLISSNISVYSVNTATGVFTAVAGSPFAAAGGSPLGIAFSPLVNGNLFAAVADNSAGNRVFVYSVNTTTGVFSAVAGSPFSAGSFPINVAFSPIVNNNLYAAVANTGNTVSVYSVNTSTGVFTQVTGSPFATVAQPQWVSFSPLVNGNLFAAITTTTGGAGLRIYTVNTSTGAFSLVSGSPFATGTTPTGNAFSPILSGGLFVATANQISSNASVFQVNTLIPTLTTLSQYILSGASVTLNGTISGGTANYAITWQDGTVQSGIATTTFSRTVTPASTTIYDVATISDSNACTAGPSNSVTIGVRTCP
jgi:6-phosphogluconolactonase (cycloisomerase 2 family)